MEFIDDKGMPVKTIEIEVTKNMVLLLDRMERYNTINDIINQIANQAIDKQDFELVLRMENRRKDNLSDQLSCLEDMMEKDKGMKDGDVLLIYNALKIKNDECDRIINLCERTMAVGWRRVMEERYGWGLAVTETYEEEEEED